MNIYDFMEGYDRSFDEDEFDGMVWEYMQRDDFEFTEDFTEELEHFLRDYGINNLHDFLKTIRIKKQMKRI